jgi:1-acyl-sn-glycerol-3-phosphate acyltransferase
MPAVNWLLTLRAFYHTLRISVPTVLDAVTGRLTMGRSDLRLRDWSETLVAITRTDLQVSGLSNIPDDACLLMSNHLSLADIPVIFAALPPQVRMRMIAKEELFRVPIWGRAMRLSGFIPINRRNLTQAKGSLEVARRHMEAGTFIWIAPEGTRSRDGALLPFKKGGFILAQQTGRPILPVRLDGTQRIVPPSGVSTYAGHQATVRFCPLIPTAGREVEDLMSELREVLCCRS